VHKELSSRATGWNVGVDLARTHLAEDDGGSQLAARDHAISIDLDRIGGSAYVGVSIGFVARAGNGFDGN
jgi:hypothetical protein